MWKLSSILVFIGLVFSQTSSAEYNCEACYQLQQQESQPQFPSEFFSSSLLNQNLYGTRNGFAFGPAAATLPNFPSVPQFKAVTPAVAPAFLPASYTYQPAFTGTGYVQGFPENFHPF